MTQIGVVEHLKLENVTLSHQLTETQHRSIKDKERIAVQLQSIEVRLGSNNPRFIQASRLYGCQCLPTLDTLHIGCLNCGVPFLYLVRRLTC